MARLRSIILSIRFRLTAIIFITALAILFQVGYTTNTQDIINIADKLGDNYKDIDQEILTDIGKLNTVVDQIYQEQLSSFMTSLIFKDILDENTGVNTTNKFHALLEEIIGDIKNRQDLSYGIKIKNTNLLYSRIAGDVEFGGIDSPLNLITTNSSSIYSKALSINENLNSTLDKNTANINQVRIAHNKNINTFSSQYINAGEGVLAKVQIELSRTVDRLLNSSDSSSTLILSLFLEQSRKISDLNILIGLVEKELFSNLEIELPKIENILQIFETNITDAKTAITEQFQQINAALDIADVETRVSNNNIFRQVLNAIERITDAIPIIGHDFPHFISNMRGNITILSNQLIDEQTNFNNEFNKKIINLRSDAQDQNLLVGFGIIALIALTSGITIIQLSRSFSRINKQLKEIQEGHLDYEGRRKYRSNEFGDIERGFDKMADELRNIIKHLQNSSNRIADISEKLASSAEEASASVQEVSNTVRDFSAGSAEQNLMLNRIADKLNDHLTEVQEASSKIGVASNYVLKVAKRSNILGLNASIEAAKAGRFGLGFDVVAEEVRDLSEDTKGSAIEIEALIGDIENTIQRTVKNIMNEVNITKDVAENTAAGSEEANAATSEQVIMLSEISQTASELSELVNEFNQLMFKFIL